LPGVQAARVEACFALIACVEDTNLLHRAAGVFASPLRGAGSSEMAWAARLARAPSTCDSFVARRLSPGGAAIFAMSCS
jgi:triphosphoribosyl-dephospho-CoA synthase